MPRRRIKLYKHEKSTPALVEKLRKELRAEAAQVEPDPEALRIIRERIKEVQREVHE